MKKIYLLVFSILMCQLINGQNPIVTLNNGGVLLVRLQTNQHVIQYHLDKDELDAWLRQNKIQDVYTRARNIIKNG